MSVVVEFTLPSESFPFGRSTSGDPKVRVRLERVVPLQEGRIPFLWATGSDFDDFERHLRDSTIVKSVEAITRVDDSVLYRVEWHPGKETFLNGIAEANGTIMEAHGDSSWSFTVRFRDHADLTKFHQFFQAEDFPVHIDRIASLDEEAGTKYELGLTPGQREAVTLAVENGYFAVPRETQLEEIADELGITRQAASERVRRATETVLRKALIGLVASDLDTPDDDSMDDERGSLS